MCEVSLDDDNYIDNVDAKMTFLEGFSASSTRLDARGVLNSRGEYKRMNSDSTKESEPFYRRGSRG
jgi:hypothetical protein